MHPVTNRAEELVGTSSSASAAVGELVAAAGGRRVELEEARDAFIDRLHRASDDHAATNALRLVYGAITVVDAENVTERSTLQPARRWSQRRRAGRRRDARARDLDARVAERAAAVERPSAADRSDLAAQAPAPAVEGAPENTDTTTDRPVRVGAGTAS